MRTTCSFCHRKSLSMWGDYGLCVKHYKTFFAMHDNLNAINQVGPSHGSPIPSAPQTPTYPIDPETGRNFDGYFDSRLDCGCVDFYHGGTARCVTHGGVV